MSVWMSRIEFSLTTTMRGIREAHATLHPDERVPAPDRPPLAPVRRVVHLQLAILRDRVVQRDDRRDPLLELEDPVAEALVVVDEVELAATRREVAQGAEAERQRLGERAGRELRQLEDVLARLDLPVGREAPGVVVVEDVEARQLRQRDALVDDRVRLAAEHLDVVAEVDERLGEVARVHALAADVRLAAVRQVGDAQRRVAERDPGAGMTGNATGRRLPAGRNGRDRDPLARDRHGRCPATTSDRSRAHAGRTCPSGAAARRSAIMPRCGRSSSGCRRRR